MAGVGRSPQHTTLHQGDSSAMWLCNDRNDRLKCRIDTTLRPPPIQLSTVLPLALVVSRQLQKRLLAARRRLI